MELRQCTECGFGVCQNCHNYCCECTKAVCNSCYDNHRQIHGLGLPWGRNDEDEKSPNGGHPRKKLETPPKEAKIWRSTAASSSEGAEKKHVQESRRPLQLRYEKMASLLHAQLEYGVASVLGRHGRTLVCTPSGATATWQDTPSYYPPGSCAGALLPLLCLFFVWYVCCAALCLCHGGDLWGMGVLLPSAAIIGSSHRVQIAD